MRAYAQARSCQLVRRYRLASAGRGGGEVGQGHRAHLEGPGEVSFAGARGGVESFGGAVRDRRWRHDDHDARDEPHLGSDRRHRDRGSGRDADRRGAGTEAAGQAVLCEHRDREFDDRVGGVRGHEGRLDAGRVRAGEFLLHAHQDGAAVWQAARSHRGRRSRAMARSASSRKRRSASGQYCPWRCFTRRSP
jgi:hypothetical protein